MKHLFSAAFAAFFIWMLSGTVAAGEPFYADDSLKVAWPDALDTVPCNPELAQRVSGACRQIGSNGSLGAVFLTIHAGYALGSEAALQAHLKSSEEALANIPRVQVMQTRILSSNPLIGMMDVLRMDGTLPSIEGLKDNTVRQTSLLIPVGSRLAQIFIYLPFEGDEAMAAYALLVDELPKGVVVTESPVVRENTQNAPPPDGALALMPRALIWGGLIALVFIAGVVFAGIKRRKQRDAEDAARNAQIGPSPPE